MLQNNRPTQGSFFSNNTGQPSSFFGNAGQGTNGPPGLVMGGGQSSFFNTGNQSASIFTRTNTTGAFGTSSGIGGGIGGGSSAFSSVNSGSNGQGSFITKWELAPCKGNRETVGCYSGSIIGLGTYSKMTLTEIRIEDYRIFKSGNMPEIFKPPLQKFMSLNHINPNVQIPPDPRGVNPLVGQGASTIGGGGIGGSSFFGGNGMNSMGRGTGAIGTGMGMGGTAIGTGMGIGTGGVGMGMGISNVGMGLMNSKPMGMGMGMSSTGIGGGIGGNSIIGSGIGMGTGMMGGGIGNNSNGAFAMGMSNNRLGGGMNNAQIGGGSFFSNNNQMNSSMPHQSSFFNTSNNQNGQTSFFNNNNNNNTGSFFNNLGGGMSNNPMSNGTFFNQNNNNGMGMNMGIMGSKMPLTFQSNQPFSMMNAGQFQNGTMMNPMFHQNQGQVFPANVPCVYILPVSSNEIQEHRENEREPSYKRGYLDQEAAIMSRYELEKRERELELRKIREQSKGIYYPDQLAGARPRWGMSSGILSDHRDPFMRGQTPIMRKARVDLKSLSMRNKQNSQSGIGIGRHFDKKEGNERSGSFVLGETNQGNNENFFERKFSLNKFDQKENLREPKKRPITTGCSFTITPNLENLDLNQLETVEDLKLENEHGRLFFPGLTDVTGINFKEAIIINNGEFQVYPDDSKRPRKGEGLNKKFYLTFKNVRKEDPFMSDTEFLGTLVQRVQEMTKKGNFHKYDSQKEEMTVEIWEV